MSLPSPFAGLQVIRPITLDDLEALFECAVSAKHGVTSLPKERALLKKKIVHSLESFSKGVEKADDELYIFVLEDIQTGKVIGTCAIVAKTGVSQPFYSYKIHTHRPICDSLNIHNEYRTLHLSTVRQGPTEVGGLVLLPSYRHGGLGKLLSLSRFLFMSSYPHRFHERVVAEMRGVIRDDGYCPFWEHVGKKFFRMDFPTANLLRAIDEQFIADLSPQYPIYADLLPPEAREVIGKTHENTEPALHLLQQEGFQFNHDVDIFDAGPDLYASFKKIKTVQNNQVALVHSIAKKESTFFPSPTNLYLTSNLEIDFRAVLSPLHFTPSGEVILPDYVAHELRVEKGCSLRYISL